MRKTRRGSITPRRPRCQTRPARKTRLILVLWPRRVPERSRTAFRGWPRSQSMMGGWVEPGGNRGDSQGPKSRGKGGRRQPERLDGRPFRTLSSFNVGHPASLRTTEGKRNSGKPLAGNGGAKSLSGTRIQCQGAQPVNCFLRTGFGVASAHYSLRATNSSLRSG
jgi:hypothetical protein